MSRLGKIVVMVAVTWFIVFTAFAGIKRSIVLQLLCIPVTLCFLVAVVASIVCFFWEWRQRRWLSLLPFGVCVASVVLSVAMVRTISHALFVWSLPSYEAVVQQMESGSIPVSTEMARIPQAESQARLAYTVLAWKDTNGVLTVTFITGGGFPVKHSGYLYRSSGVIEPGSLADSLWPHRQEKRPKWFSVSD
jgi:hypothetical protein